ncbi:hypothetical protein PQE68_gp075 [Bacillus phage vB_BanS_Sophrita]|uniref:Uncharacterized protein n=1 Tax=Bacillus phage vB_BanS_Sophrita TaxID=2894790 RepID=A0AAE8YVA5_9CAUD|nr:hypothetical protein PQE68_gp075 [Bacillus phage vB_BanS_Sophrita]UGO50666.1 hypothetical protein SOPHRITA_75 [Bacillus phage vB_BanS_Sophrita]
MLSRVATWYLRKRKKSVIIGFETTGGEVKSLNQDTYYFDNEFDHNTTIKNYDDSTFLVPQGKFKIKITSHSKQNKT